MNNLPNGKHKYSLQVIGFEKSNQCKGKISKANPVSFIFVYNAKQGSCIPSTLPASAPQNLPMERRHESAAPVLRRVERPWSCRAIALVSMCACVRVQIRVTKCSHLSVLSQELLWDPNLVPKNLCPL